MSDAKKGRGLMKRRPVLLVARVRSGVTRYLYWHTKGGGGDEGQTRSEPGLLHVQMAGWTDARGTFKVAGPGLALRCRADCVRPRGAFAGVMCKDVAKRETNLTLMLLIKRRKEKRGRAGLLLPTFLQTDDTERERLDALALLSSHSAQLLPSPVLHWLRPCFSGSSMAHRALLRGPYTVMIR